MSYQILLIYSHCIYICVCACVWVRGMCISWHISGSQKTTLCFSPHLLLTIFLACFSIAEAQGPFASCDSLVFSFQSFSSGSLELWICSLLYPDFYMGSRNGILGCLLCSKRHWAIFSALNYQILGFTVMLIKLILSSIGIKINFHGEEGQRRV